MNRNLLLLFAAFAGSFFTQAALAQCQDPWINAAYKGWGQTPRNIGNGTTGDCSVNNYGGATWGSYPNAQAVLTGWVTNSRICPDPWIGEAFWTATGRSANAAAGQCNAALYGSWANFPQLVGLVKAYLSRPAPSAAASVKVPAVYLVSTSGAKCLGVSGGNTNPKTQIILWNCDSTKPDQSFRFLSNGQVEVFSGNTNPALCVDDNGGLGKPGDQIWTWPCSQSASRWRLLNGRLMSAGNKCIDLMGGWLGIQNAILNVCGVGTPVGTNQGYNAGIAVARGTSVNPVNPGVASMMNLSGGSAVISNDGGSIVASGAGNIVASGAGNIVASGAGNIVASGAGNIVIVAVASSIVNTNGSN